MSTTCIGGTEPPKLWGCRRWFRCRRTGGEREAVADRAFKLELGTREETRACFDVCPPVSAALADARRTLAMKLPVLLLAPRRLHSPPCRRGRSAQHPVDHQRGQRSSSRLLRRQVRRHAESRSPGRARRDLSKRLVERAGLRAPAHDDHLRRLSAGDRFGAHAEQRPLPPT